MAPTVPGGDADANTFTGTITVQNTFTVTPSNAGATAFAWGGTAGATPVLALGTTASNTNLLVNGNIDFSGITSGGANITNASFSAVSGQGCQIQLNPTANCTWKSDPNNLTNFGNVEINGGAAIKVTLTSNVTVTNLKLTAGILDLGAFKLTVTGQLIVQGGTLQSTTGGQLTVQGAASLSSGTINLSGITGATATTFGGGFSATGGTLNWTGATINLTDNAATVNFGGVTTLTTTAASILNLSETGNGTVTFKGGVAFPGSVNYTTASNMALAVSSGTTLTIGSNFSFPAGGTGTCNVSGIAGFTVSGTFSMSAAGTFQDTTAANTLTFAGNVGPNTAGTLNVNGTVTVVMTGVTETFTNLTLTQSANTNWDVNGNASAQTVTFPVSITGDVQGPIANTSTLTFTAGNTVSGNLTLPAGTGTLTLGSNVTVSSTIDVKTGETLNVQAAGATTQQTLTASAGAASGLFIESGGSLNTNGGILLQSSATSGVGQIAGTLKINSGGSPTTGGQATFTSPPQFGGTINANDATIGGTLTFLAYTAANGGPFVTTLTGIMTMGNGTMVLPVVADGTAVTLDFSNQTPASTHFTWTSTGSIQWLAQATASSGGTGDILGAFASATLQLPPTAVVGSLDIGNFGATGETFERGFILQTSDSSLLTVQGSFLVDPTSKWPVAMGGTTPLTVQGCMVVDGNNHNAITACLPGFLSPNAVTISGGGAGTGTVTNGSPTVTLVSGLSPLPNDVVQFASQPGVSYVVISPITANSFTLSADYNTPTNYTGATTSGTAISMPSLVVRQTGANGGDTGNAQTTFRMNTIAGAAGTGLLTVTSGGVDIEASSTAGFFGGELLLSTLADSLNGAVNGIVVETGTTANGILDFNAASGTVTKTLTGNFTDNGSILDAAVANVTYSFQGTGTISGTASGTANAMTFGAVSFDGVTTLGAVGNGAPNNNFSAKSVTVSAAHSLNLNGGTGQIINDSGNFTVAATGSILGTGGANTTAGVNFNGAATVAAPQVLTDNTTAKYGQDYGVVTLAGTGATTNSLQIAGTGAGVSFDSLTEAAALTTGQVDYNGNILALVGTTATPITLHGGGIVDGLNSGSVLFGGGSGAAGTSVTVPASSAVAPNMVYSNLIIDDSAFTGANKNFAAGTISVAIAHTGGLDIRSGTLAFGASNLTVTGNVNVNDSANAQATAHALVFTQTGTLTFNGVLATPETFDPGTSASISFGNITTGTTAAVTVNNNDFTATGNLTVGANTSFTLAATAGTANQVAGCSVTGAAGGAATLTLGAPMTFTGAVALGGVLGKLGTMNANANVTFQGTVGINAFGTLVDTTNPIVMTFAAGAGGTVTILTNGSININPPGSDPTDLTGAGTWFLNLTSGVAHTFQNLQVRNSNADSAGTTGSLFITPTAPAFDMGGNSGWTFSGDTPPDGVAVWIGTTDSTWDTASNWQNGHSSRERTAPIPSCIPQNGGPGAAAPQTIASAMPNGGSYTNITLNGTFSGTVKIPATATVTLSGTLTISAGTFAVNGRALTLTGASPLGYAQGGGTLDLSPNGTASTMNVAGDWTATAGTIADTGPSSTVVFNGTSAQTIKAGQAGSGALGTNNFNKVSVQCTGATVTFSTNPVLTASTFIMLAATNTAPVTFNTSLTVGTALTVDGNSAASTLTLSGGNTLAVTAGATLNRSTTLGSGADAITAGVTVGNGTNAATLTKAAGTLTLNGTGNFTVSSTGTLTVAGTVTFGGTHSGSVSGTGTLTLTTGAANFNSVAGTPTSLAGNVNVGGAVTLGSVANAGGTLQLGGHVLGCGGNLTLLTGTVQPSLAGGATAGSGVTFNPTVAATYTWTDTTLAAGGQDYGAVTVNGASGTIVELSGAATSAQATGSAATPALTVSANNTFHLFGGTLTISGTYANAPASLVSVAGTFDDGGVASALKLTCKATNAAQNFIVDLSAGFTNTTVTVNPATPLTQAQTFTFDKPTSILGLSVTNSGGAAPLVNFAMSTTTNPLLTLGTGGLSTSTFTTFTESSGGINTSGNVAIAATAAGSFVPNTGTLNFQGSTAMTWSCASTDSFGAVQVTGTGGLTTASAALKAGSLSWGTGSFASGLTIAAGDALTVTGLTDSTLNTGTPALTINATGALLCGGGLTWGPNTAASITNNSANNDTAHGIIFTGNGLWTSTGSTVNFGNVILQLAGAPTITNSTAVNIEANSVTVQAGSLNFSGGTSELRIGGGASAVFSVAGNGFVPSTAATALQFRGNATWSGAGVTTFGGVNVHGNATNAATVTLASAVQASTLTMDTTTAANNGTLALAGFKVSLTANLVISGATSTGLVTGGATAGSGSSSTGTA